MLYLGHQRNNQLSCFYQDNLGTKAFALDEKSLHCMKHIEVKYHFIKNHIAKNTFKIVHAPSSQMTADIFTKFVPPSKHAFHLKALYLATLLLKGVCEKMSIE